MSETETNNKKCVVIGAGQAGVTLAFTLREEGWEGEIVLIDADSNLPYYRPPLSKTILTGSEDIKEHILFPAQLYKKENIILKLGVKTTAINRKEKHIVLEDDTTLAYDKLVIATGGCPIVPGIDGIDTARNVFTIRTATDANTIRKAFENSTEKRVTIIGGGYIGLETAASLRKLGARVTVLEREERVLARVTAPEMSQFFLDLHTENGVDMLTGKNVVSIESLENVNTVICSDGSKYMADIIIVGVGIFVNKELAEDAGLKINNGIVVDATSRSSDDDIYAIGDCTYHYNPFYERYIRLESIQNASDQAKVAAAAICGKNPEYDSLPWFWSDQYDVKLQMAGLSEGYNHVLVRKEKEDTSRFSVWYFKNDKLLAVDAVNNTKAYVIGMKFIKGNLKIDKDKLTDLNVDFKPANLLLK